METIEIPKAEYEKLVNSSELLQNHELLSKLDEIISVLYERKFGLYLGEYTNDLTEANINLISEWQVEGSVWDAI